MKFSQLGWIALVLPTFSWSAEPVPDPQFVNDVLVPFVAKYCADCHTGADAEAGIALENFPSATQFGATRTQWVKVVGQLRGKGMPPADAEQPSDEERTKIADWIESAMDYVDCTGPVDPGHVTLCRLNKVEYNNTIRDLLAVDYRPADDFPSDDVGHGFDNIGDVLSISPILIEKYLAAAEEVARRAIIVPQQITTVELRLEAERMRLKGGGGSVDEGTAQRMTSNGELYKVITLPARGEYEIAFRAYGEQAGPESAKARLRLGGSDPHEFDVSKTKENPGEFQATVAAEAGRQRISLEFLNDYCDRDNPEPAKRGDRNLVIDYVAIKGPTKVITDANPRSHELVLFKSISPESPSDDLRDILARLATRAFRRPVTDREVGRLVGIVDLARQNGEPIERGIQLAVQAVLVSPYFLFRVEPDDERNPGAVRDLTDYELATRLSYFLWSSMPDEELFDLAAAGRLRDDEILRAQVYRMIASDKSDAFVENFAGQWLQLRNLELRQPDRDIFPNYSSELRRSMKRETEMFFATILREDRSLLELLDADYTFVDARLAKHYGIEGVEGDEFRRVRVGALPRGGILTQASILTLTSDPTRTSPVKRGKYVLEALLGTPPAAPPPNVPPLEKQQKQEAKTIRERMELHRANPNCAACHTLMDPIGFGLETFNAIGEYHDRDGDLPIDASGVLPDGSKFSGPKELARVLLERKELFTRNLVRNMLTYATGRGLNHNDECVVRQISDRVAADGYKMATLVWEVVRSDPFRKRRGTLTKETP